VQYSPPEVWKKIFASLSSDDVTIISAARHAPSPHARRRVVFMARGRKRRAGRAGVFSGSAV